VHLRGLQHPYRWLTPRPPAPRASPDIVQVFVPPVQGRRVGQYVPRLCGAADVGFENTKVVSG